LRLVIKVVWTGDPYSIRSDLWELVSSKSINLPIELTGSKKAAAGNTCRGNTLLNSEKTAKSIDALFRSCRVPHCFAKRTMAMKLLILFSLVVLAGCAHKNTAVREGKIAPSNSLPAAAPDPSTAALARAEQIRAGCVQGRRLICGRVLKISPDGLVVDSGYTDLLRPPLTQSWVVPGTAIAHRDPTVLELMEPGTPSIGVVFLTDIPKRPKVNIYDYVIIMGYPAGHYTYTPAPNVEKVIRKFAAGLETAVRLRLQSE